MENNRNKEWLEIWDKKYDKFDGTQNTHVLDGFDSMSLEEWQRLVNYFLNRIGIQSGDTVLEVGCGAGAFIKEINNCKNLFGVDYSESAINTIKQVVDGKFYCAEANKLPFEDNVFDVVMSFGVFFYFDSLEYAKEAFEEIIRVMKPTGTLFIGDVNDLDKKEIADRLRGESAKERASKYLSDKTLDHLYFPKSFFEQLAEANNLSIDFIEESETIEFYYNAQYRYSILLKAK